MHLIAYTNLVVFHGPESNQLCGGCGPQTANCAPMA